MISNDDSKDHRRDDVLIIKKKGCVIYSTPRDGSHDTGDEPLRYDHYGLIGIMNI